MIWHIFKKDVRLLWPYIAGVAALQFVHAAGIIRLGLFNEPRTLQMLMTTSNIIVQAAVAVLIVLAVHQEAVQGTRQDWLGRPVRRRDLLLAKLLFAAVAVFGPVFAAEALIAATHGFAAGTILASTFAATVSQFVTTGLPVLMLASLTATLLEALAGLLIVWLAAYALAFMAISIDQFTYLSVMWQHFALKFIIILAGAAIILPLQYFRRRTLVLRVVFAAGVLLALGVSQFPRSAAYAIEESLSPDPAFAAGVSIAFDPSQGRFLSGGGESAPEDPFFYLPLRVAGLPRDTMLVADYMVITLTAANGKVLFHDTPYRNMSDETNHDGDPGLRLRLANSDNGMARLHQGFHIPLALFTRIKSQPVSVRIDYSLTLLKRSLTAAIPAISGAKAIAGLGLCASRRRSSFYGDVTDDVEVHCFRTADAPDCITVFARDTKSAARDPVQEECYGLNYEPLAWRLAELEMPGQQVASYRFRSLTRSEPYPIQIDQVAQAELAITGYTPQAHFARRLTTPPIRLADWAIQIVPRLPRRLLE